MPALCQTEWESDTISAWNQCGKVRTSGSWRHASQTQCAEFSLPPEGQRGYWTDIRRSISNNSEIWKSNISGILTAPRLLKGKCCFSKVFQRFGQIMIGLRWYAQFDTICIVLGLKYPSKIIFNEWPWNEWTGHYLWSCLWFCMLVTIVHLGNTSLPLWFRQIAGF